MQQVVHVVCFNSLIHMYFHFSRLPMMCVPYGLDVVDYFVFDAAAPHWVFSTSSMCSIFKPHYVWCSLFLCNLNLWLCSCELWAVSLLVWTHMIWTAILSCDSASEVSMISAVFPCDFEPCLLWSCENVAWIFIANRVSCQCCLWLIVWLVA